VNGSPIPAGLANSPNGSYYAAKSRETAYFWSAQPQTGADGEGPIEIRHVISWIGGTGPRQHASNGHEHSSEPLQGPRQHASNGHEHSSEPLLEYPSHEDPLPWQH
jgi:hypothetical protein